MKNNTSNAPKFRTGALSVKEFYKLSPTEKQVHIARLVLIPEEDRGDIDTFILRFYSPEIKQARNFFSFEEELY
jgi:hypothetical protein